MTVRLPAEKPERLCPQRFGKHDLPEEPSVKNAVVQCPRCDRWFRTKWFNDNVGWCGYSWVYLRPWHFRAKRVKDKS